MSNGRRGSISNIAALLSGVLLIAVVVLGAVIWGETLAPGFKARVEQRTRNAMLDKQAGELGLTYESVLAEPAKALDKPAVWCLSRAGAEGALYQGQEDKPLHISNAGRMPNNYGSSHQTCVKTLVTINSVTAMDFGGVRGLRLEVYFVGYP